MFVLVEFERHIKTLEKKLECVKRDVVKEEEVLLPDCYLGPNPDFVSASKSIELRYTKSTNHKNT